MSFLYKRFHVQLCTIQIDDQAVFAHCSLVLLVDEEKRKRHKLIDNERFRKDRSERKSKLKLEFVFYVKTDDSPYWSDAVLYRKSGFGTAKGYKQKVSKVHMRVKYMKC